MSFSTMPRVGLVCPLWHIDYYNLFSGFSQDTVLSH